MKFDMTARALVLEKKDCQTCQYGAGGPGEYTGTMTCRTCHGTGNGARGGKGKCKPCYGRGTENDFDNPIVCPRCNGNYAGFQDENFCDWAPVNAILSMPIRVARLNRDNTFNENFLGIGTVWSCTDYGTAAGMSDAAVVEKVTEQLRTDHIQATKIVQPYERGDKVALLHDALVIAVTNTGYSVRAMSNLPALEDA